MEFTIVPDTSIVALNCRGEGNGSCNIIYRDAEGELITIDFDICAENYSAEHKDSSGRCIGERKADEGSFIFSTNGLKTRIVFKSIFPFNPFRRPFLKGTRSARFHALQKFILEAGYTTFDLS